MPSVIDTIRHLLERPGPAEPVVSVPLDEQSIDRLLHLLCDTRDEELSCEEVFARLDEYVDCLVSHQHVMDGQPLLEHHLSLCPDCRDELTALQQALAEVSGE